MYKFASVMPRWVLQFKLVGSQGPIPESFEQQSFQSLKTIVSTNICVTPVRYLFEAFPLHGIDQALGSDGNPGTFNLAQWV